METELWLTPRTQVTLNRLFAIGTDLKEWSDEVPWLRYGWPVIFALATA